MYYYEYTNFPRGPHVREEEVWGSGSKKEGNSNIGFQEKGSNVRLASAV